MYFEIQVKTILEHAWAQIEHDRNYKYKGLPKDIQHDFYIAAGILESADKQFDSISKRIEKYEKSISQKTKQGKLDEIEIDPANLKRYLSDKFGKFLKIELLYGDKDDNGESTVKELTSLQIHNLHQLDEIIPDNFVEHVQRCRELDYSSRDYENLSSMVFNILMMVFGEKAYDALKKTRNMSKKHFMEYLTTYQSITKSS